MSITDEDQLKEIYADAKTIAVVGASGSEEKPAHTIPRYLQRNGYRVIPVTPRGGELLGEKVYERLTDIEEPIDVVDVFRPSDETPDVARDAVKVGAKVLWLQEGITSDEAEQIASEGGLKVVMDTCMGATHHRLIRMQEGPGPRE